MNCREAYEYLKSETSLKDADFAQVFYPKATRRQAAIYFANTSRREIYIQAIVRIAEMLAQAGFADPMWSLCDECGHRTINGRLGECKNCKTAGEPA